MVKLHPSLGEPLCFIINKLFTPSQQHSTTQVKTTFSFTANKAILALQISTLLLFTLHMLISQVSLLAGTIRYLLYTIVHVCLLLVCKHSQVMFRICWTILWSISSLIGLASGQISIQSVYIITLTAPILQYLYVKDAHLLTLQTGIQLLFFCTTYHNSLIEAATYQRPEDLAQGFQVASIVNIMFVYFVVILVSRPTTSTYNCTAEKKEHDDQDTLLLTLSHELRNLINSLLGNIRLASLEDTLSVHTKDLLINSEICGDLLLHLVNNILDSGKIESGQLEVDLAPAEVSVTFRRVWSICSELIERKGLQGRMKIHKCIPHTLKMDHHKVTQVLLNLINNSLKFTDAGSINMSVQWLEEANCVTESSFKPHPFNDSDEDQEEGLFEKNQRFQMLKNEYLNDSIPNIVTKQLSMSSFDVGGCGILKIIISDTGCGMTKEDSQKLFRKFSQVGSSQSKKQLGTGLGLYICKQLCEGMGGEIKVYSKKDKGTYFVLCLPMESC